MNNLLQAFDNEVAKHLSPEEYEKYLELVDKREAESHDITKSTFGYE